MKRTPANKMKIMDERTYNVVKSNMLVQRSKFDLSVVEQRIILRLVQIIRPDDKEFVPYIFSIKEFCEICGINDQSGKTYNYILNVIQELRAKNLMLKDGNKDVVCGWINEAVYDRSTGTIEIMLSEHLKPYLLELKNNFTEYSLFNILSMKSKYSIRMYELLKSYEYMKQTDINLDILKISLHAINYERWADFKRYVLDMAVNEINKYTDIKVSYTLKKQGKRFSSITFTINTKTSDEMIDAMYSSKFLLNSKKDSETEENQSQ